MTKQHYWIVNSKKWNVDHCDEFSIDFATNVAYINKDSLNQIKQFLSKHRGGSPEQYIIVNISYLGEMTKEEWEN